MREIFRRLIKFIENFNRGVYWMSSFAILLSGLILTYQAVMRYMLNIPTIWEIEASMYLGIIMATFMGAPYGLKAGAHVNIDLVTRVLPTRVKDTLRRFTWFLCLLFCIYLSYNGWRLWWEACSKGWRSESIWGPPLSIPYLFLPLGFTLLSIQFIIQIFELGKLEERLKSDQDSHKK